MATKLGKHYRKGRELMKAAGGKVESGFQEFILEGQEVIAFKKECQAAGVGWEAAFRDQQEEVGYSLNSAKGYMRLAEQPRLVNQYVQSLLDDAVVEQGLPSLTGALTYVRKNDPRDQPAPLQKSSAAREFARRVKHATRLSNELAGLLADIQEEHEANEYDIDATVQADFYGAIETLQLATQGQFTKTASRRRLREVS